MPLTHAQFVRATWPSAEVFAVCSNATVGQDAGDVGRRNSRVRRDVFFGVSLVCLDLKMINEYKLRKWLLKLVFLDWIIKTLQIIRYDILYLLHVHIQT